MMMLRCYSLASSLRFNKQPLFEQYFYQFRRKRWASTLKERKNISPPQKRLDVAIMGMPNAGKSQLLNQILQTKVAAVSRKRHTTRKGVFGAKTIADTQLVFVDTCGYMTQQDAEAEASILKKLVEFAKENVADCDVSLLVVDAAKALTDPVRETLASLMLHSCLSYVQQKQNFLDHEKKEFTKEEIASCFASVPLVIVLNKVDLVRPKSNLLPLAYELSVMADSCWEKAELLVKEEIKSSKNGKVDEESGALTIPPENADLGSSSSLERKDVKSQHQREECPVFMISALHNDGVDDILKMLTREAMPGEWMLEADESTDMSPEERAQEIIREKIYRSVHREVPHQVFLPDWNRRFEYIDIPQKQIEYEQNSGRYSGIPSISKTTVKILRIEQDLIVQTKSHKRLLQGKNGATLERITNQSQRDLEHLFQCKVSLALRVKVKRNNNARAQEQDDDDDDE